MQGSDQAEVGGPVIGLELFMAVVPGLYAGVFARTPIAPANASNRSLREVLSDFRSVGAILFALLLFFQFGNEWSIAGWLPIFLIRRVGLSQSGALMILALYWTVLLFGRSGYVGRLIGTGLVRNKTNWDTSYQFFRMDYHDYHSGFHRGDFAHWDDQPFHYHIPYN